MIVENRNRSSRRYFTTRLNSSQKVWGGGQLTASMITSFNLYRKISEKSFGM
jgi:hypothetical protein